MVIEKNCLTGDNKSSLDTSLLLYFKWLTLFSLQIGLIKNSLSNPEPFPKLKMFADNNLMKMAESSLNGEKSQAYKKIIQAISSDYFEIERVCRRQLHV